MGDLRDGFDRSVDASSLVTEVDAGLVAAGRKIADQIDHATDNLTGQEVTKALYLTPHLVNILREMLATPAARKGQAAPSGRSKKTEEASGGDSNGSALGTLRGLKGGKAG